MVALTISLSDSRSRRAKHQLLGSQVNIFTIMAGFIRTCIPGIHGRPTTSPLRSTYRGGSTVLGTLLQYKAESIGSPNPYSRTGRISRDGARPREDPPHSPHIDNHADI